MSDGRAMVGKPRVRYVVDASSWVSIEDHPAQNSILSAISDLIAAGKFECPRRSWEEVVRCDSVLTWLGRYENHIVNSHRSKLAYLALLGEIAKKYPKMCGTRGRKNKADPYVVANAVYGKRTSNSTRFMVVADEGRGTRRKISKACDDYDVECLSLMQMLRRELPNGLWRR